MDISAIQEAKDALDSHQFVSRRAAARHFDVDRDTLRRRKNGTLSRQQAHEKEQNLSSEEEQFLLAWIQAEDLAGASPTYARIRAMANIMYQHQVTPPRTLSIGKNWINKFKKRHPELENRRVRRIDIQRKDSIESIPEFFEWLRICLDQRSIKPENQYNIDETAVKMALEGSEWVLTFLKGKIELPDHPNKELSTFIECISATGLSLPFLAIFKGKKVLDHWFVQEPGITREGLEAQGHRFYTSPKGWSSGSLAISWLKDVFIPHTKPSNPNDWRLLICDGHGSHATPEFRYICFENRIQVLYLTPHSSHLLQPLDISVFGPLKHFWKQGISILSIYLPSTPICKRIITSTYPRARIQALTERNITHGFEKAGIHPFQPEVLLNTLPQHQSHQSEPAPDPVILPRQSFTALQQPLAPITGNRQLRSIESQTSALRAEISFVRASNEKLSIENSILRKPKITKKRKRHLNQEMRSQAEIYEEAAANYEKEAVVIRQKAAKLRTNKQNEP
jgi:DDE superfamily endonuclease/Tc5 transposase DNA-binding domain